MSGAWVALGSNLDKPQRQVEAGLRALQSIPSTTLEQTSSLYRTLPWGMTGQPVFINAVVALDTELEPHDLLQALQAVEQQHGRRRDGPRWGPRTLDLDLLLYDQCRIDTPELTVPHPHMAERAFVLVPLAEIAPHADIPGKGRVDELLQWVDVASCRKIV